MPFCKLPIAILGFRASPNVLGYEQGSLGLGVERTSIKGKPLIVALQVTRPPGIRLFGELAGRGWIHGYLQSLQIDTAE